MHGVVLHAVVLHGVVLHGVVLHGFLLHLARLASVDIDPAVVVFGA